MARMRGRLLFDSKEAEVLYCNSNAFTFALSSVWATNTPEQTPYHQIALRPTPYHSLHVIRKGHCTFIFPDGSMIQVPEGKFIIIPPGLSDKILTESTSFSKLTFRFRIEPTPTKEGELYAAFNEYVKTVRTYSFSQNTAILDEQIRLLYEEPGYDLHATLLSLGQALVLSVVNTVMKVHDEKMLIHDARIRQVVENLDHNICADTTVNSLAERVQLSSRQLNRLFGKELGMTAGEYIIKARQNRLRQLLMNPELSLADIVCMMNYSDLASLGRDFKHAEGLTPKQFRKTMKIRE